MSKQEEERVKPELGEVVYFNGIQHINLGLTFNREDAGSTTYDRQYRLVPFTAVKFVEYGKDDVLLVEGDKCIKVHITSSKEPFIKADRAGYNIIKTETIETYNNREIRVEETIRLVKKVPKITVEY